MIIAYLNDRRLWSQQLERRCLERPLKSLQVGQLETRKGEQYLLQRTVVELLQLAASQAHKEWGQAGLHSRCRPAPNSNYSHRQT